MDIKITAKNIKLTPAIKEFINTRVGKIENFFDNIGGWEIGINSDTGVIYHARMK